MSDQVHWGIISSAKIARTALVPAIHDAANARLLYLGTPNAERVRENALQYGYQVLSSYEAVLEHPEIDAIYIPLPNGMHADWSIRALEAGKHVLCEKPLTVRPSETEELLAAQKRAGKWLMEAFMYRFHPQMEIAKEVLDSGRIGTLRMIRTCFSFAGSPDPSNPRFQKDQGPGALLDVGCYCINATRFFSGGAPLAVSAWSTWDPVSEGDFTTAGVLEYATHGAVFDCSFEATFRSGIEIVGDKGRIELPKPWLPGKDPAPVHLWDERGEEVVTAPGVNHYQLMVEHFSDCILHNRPPVRGPEDALENLRVLEAIRRSARERRRVTLDEV